MLVLLQRWQKDAYLHGITIAISIAGAFVCPGRGVGMKTKGFVQSGWSSPWSCRHLRGSRSKGFWRKELLPSTLPSARSRDEGSFQIFPVLAKQMNVTGKVKIEVTISPDGRVNRHEGGSGAARCWSVLRWTRFKKWALRVSLPKKATRSSNSISTRRQTHFSGGGEGTDGHAVEA